MMNFKGLELLIGTYSVPGERTVRKLVNAVRMADVVTGAGIHPSIIDRLIESELNKPMKGIYEFFGHDVNGNAICSIELPGDANPLDGTDLIKKEMATALGPGYAKLLVVDREGMSGGQLEKRRSGGLV